MATRNAAAEWQGDLRSGAGTFEGASGVISGKYSFKTRFEDEPGTNPEELIAAAHASCFSMALSNILAEAGHVPESVNTTAKVHFRIIEGAPTISQIDLLTEGKVPGIDQDEFAGFAQQAKEGCPVSRALAAVGEITLDATLI
jgi:osmotically inducible protein OsmC